MSSSSRGEGYVFAMGPCLLCTVPFTFNPNSVPSHRDDKGVKQPICRACINKLNARRAEKDLPPLEIQPDAYSAIPENEL